MKRHVCTTIVLVIAYGLLVVQPARAQRRNITEKDIFAFVWVADPQISPGRIASRVRAREHR